MVDGDRRLTRQERREHRLRKRRERIRKHGRSLAATYRDAILKRLRRKRGGEPG